MILDKEDLEEGTIAALMLRFREYRLPRAKRLLERVKSGAILTDEDIAFLKRVHKDGMHVQPLMKRHPEYDRLISRTMDLYTEIITRGLENEKATGTDLPDIFGEDPSDDT
jgi:hypothetical protein